MNRIILDDIPFEVDEPGLAGLLKIRPGSRSADEFSGILREARSVARPKAAFVVSSVDKLSGEAVAIGGVTFTSRVLRVNLEHATISYPFVATCGQEIEEWSQQLNGMLHSFWADSIKLMALGCALGHFEAYLKEKTGIHGFSSMNPGSLPDWPIQEQAPLFEILGDAAAAIGVRLTGSMVIMPLKSVSGIQFISGDGFVNCSLCPREGCKGRRAPYDASLYGARYERS
ncbi:MAG: vitamin B12 dependent methionine synthase [Syntrophaceae bacterium]